jgi:HEAT repeat protein
LAELQKDKQASIPVLIEGLQKEPDRRLAAAVALSQMGPEAIPALIEALDDRDSVVRIGATRALARMGPQAKEAIPALRVASKDEVILVSVMAVTALGRLGPDGIPGLIAALKDQRDWHIPEAALVALKLLGPQGAPAVPQLLETLKHPNGDVRRNAADALWVIDPAAAAKFKVPKPMEAPPGASSRRDPRARGGDKAVPSGRGQDRPR